MKNDHSVKEFSDLKCPTNSASNNIIPLVYERLLKAYGPQGWWPLVSFKGINPTKSGSINGYHPSNYSFPETKDQQFEISIGAILTQNTAWPNVEKALLNLNEYCGINCEKVNNLKLDKLKELIRPAGFFNQKSLYIKNYCSFFLKLKERIPTRKELLNLKGIGEESADSILLYAFKEPEFVIDAYTRRIFSHLGIIDGKEKYKTLKELFQSNLEKDLVIYQEYHALIVEHAKSFYSKKPHGNNDTLLNDIIEPSNL